MTGFLDRDDEKTRLTAVFSEEQTRRKHVFVRAPTGFGKTTLVNHTLESIPVSYARVQIPQSQTRAEEPGYFGRKIIASIRATRTQVRKRLRLATAVSRLLERALVALSLFVDVIPYAQSAGNSIRALIRFIRNEPIADWSQQQLHSHLVSFFEETRRVLVIENAQLFDLDSIEALSESLRNLQTYTILFEFTEHDNPPWNPEQIFKLLPSHDAKTFDLRLDKLPETFVADLLDASGFLQRQKVQFLARYKGNLIELTSLRDVVRLTINEGLAEGDMSLENSLSLRFSRLSTNARILLAQVVSYDDILTRAQLAAIASYLDSSGFFDVLGGLDELVSERFISINRRDEILLEHDQYRVLQIAPSSKDVVQLATENWMRVFHTLLSHEDFSIFGSRSIIVKLYIFSSQRADVRSLETLMGHLCALANRSGQPGFYLRILIEGVRNVVDAGQIAAQRKHTQKMAERVCVWAYQFRVFDLAREALDMSGGSAGDTVLSALVHLGLEDFDAARVSLERLVASRREDPMTAGWIAVIRIVLTQLTGRQAEARSLWANALDDPKLQKLPEFGFVLRLAEYFEPLENAVRLLSASVTHFEGLGFTGPAAYSRMSRANLLTRLGRFRAARDEMANGRATLVSKPMDRQSFLNNSGLLEYFAGSPLAKVEELFHTALTAFHNEFAKCCIFSNMAAVYSIYGKRAQAIEYATSCASRVTTGSVKNVRLVRKIRRTVELVLADQRADRIEHIVEPIDRFLSELPQVDDEEVFSHLGNSVDLRAAEKYHLIFLVHQIPELDSLQAQDRAA